MSAADAEDIAFASSAQLLFDIANTIDSIARNPPEWCRRGYGACDHARCKLWLGRKADTGRHICGFQDDLDRRSIPSEDTACDR